MSGKHSISPARAEVSKTARRALRHWLLDRGMSETQLAEKLGINPGNFFSLLSVKNKTFSGHRCRLLVEREIGACLWTDRAEYEELAEIGATLGVDIFTAKLTEIRAAAWRAGVRDDATGAGVPAGFPIFRALIRHFFPQSKSIHATHYEVQPPKS